MTPLVPGACRTGQLFLRGHRARVARLPVGEPEGLMPNLLSNREYTGRVKQGIRAARWVQITRTIEQASGPNRASTDPNSNPHLPVTSVGAAKAFPARNTSHDVRDDPQAPPWRTPRTTGAMRVST